jgi:hypothetical protein
MVHIRLLRWREGGSLPVVVVASAVVVAAVAALKGGKEAENEE